MEERCDLSEFFLFIARNKKINSKEELMALAIKELGMEKQGSLFHHPHFILRFSQIKGKSFGNTVISLAKLVENNEKPCIVLVANGEGFFCRFINISFVTKASHSSQKLTVDNIKGSINGSDIMKEFEGLKNSPENFEVLFARHQTMSLEENIQRIVSETDNISLQKKNFLPPSPSEK